MEIEVENTRKLVLLVGKSGSGKNHLCEVLGLTRVVSCTTRPARPNEVDGLDYHFKQTGRAEIEQAVNSEIAAPAIFDGNLYYATEDEVMSKDVYIVEPTGVEWFRKKWLPARRPYKVVELRSPWYRRLKRMIRRETCRGGSLITAVRSSLRRMSNDRRSFRNFACSTVIKT